MELLTPIKVGNITLKNRIIQGWQHHPEKPHHVPPADHRL